MSKRAWIIFGIICVIAIGAMVWLSMMNRIDVSGIDETKTLEASKLSGNIGDQLYGKRDSKVLLIEYGDFQCPSCYQAHAPVQAVTEKYKDQLAFVFRNFPITNKHPNARAAAAAAEAAGLQGKYWEMHNLLFENQSSWEALDSSKRSDYFPTLASQLGLDIEMFKKDMGADNVNRKISFDQELGKKAGIVGTPMFVLNGKKVEDSVWQDKEKFEALIKEALTNAGIELPVETTEVVPSNDAMQP